MNSTQASLSGLLGRDAAEQSRLGYAHTANEIAQQPELWLETRDIMIAAIPKLKELCASARRMVLTGAGTSYYVALSVLPAIKSKFSGAEAVSTTDIVMDPETCFPDEPFVLISFARSGNSPETMAVVDLAEQIRPGLATHIAVTCNKSGRLASGMGNLGKRGFTVLLPERSNDKGLAMTSSYSCMTVAGFAFSCLDHPQAYREIAAGLSAMAGSVLDPMSDAAKKIAAEAYERMFFIVSRPGFGGAMEAHLKVQELSAGKTVVKADDTLGLRHGFLVSIDSHSLVVLFLSRDPYRRRFELDLLKEFRDKKLGRQIVVVCEKEGASEVRSPTVRTFEYDADPAVADHYKSPIIALFGQLIGMHNSIRLGLHPDNPSPSGVINRVVQGVTIYPFEKTGKA